MNSGCHDMLIVLDPDDLAKSYLIDTRVLKNVSAAFADLCEQSAQASRDFKQQSLLRHLLFLEFTEAMPKLKAVALDREREPIVYPKSEITAEEVKHEDVAATDSDHREIFAANHHSADSATWVKAYYSFLHMLDGEHNHKIPKKDPELALPQIERVLKIAREYQARHRLSTAFDVLFLGYIQKGMLWQAIEEAPQQWLNVGIELHSRVVFDEAFKHLVGKSANCEHGITFDGLPSNMQEYVLQRSDELYCKRLRVEKALLMLTLPATEPNANTGGGSTDSASFVNQYDRPIEYSVVNIFRDWMAAHIGALDNLGKVSQETDKISALKKICDHENDCDTVAGLYEVISSGGNAYLDAEDVCTNWNTAYFGKVNSYKVKRPLEALKEKASKLVAEFVDTTLKLENTDELPYLTCVKIKPDDVPWKSEQGDESDEEMEEE